MDSGFYAAFTGLQARIEALDVVANNIANVNTTGFKAQHEFYRGVLASRNGFLLSSLNRAINDYGVLGGTAVDLGSGSLERTGNSLDAAIQGPGFFVVQTGSGSVLTRDGAFQLNAKRQITTATGDLVLGQRGPIVVPPGEISIGQDGTVSAAGAVAGKLKIVELANGTRPEPVGNTYFSVPQPAMNPPANSQVRQGMLESANVDAVSGSVALIDLQRHAELLQKALAIIDADFNKTAIEQLPQV